VYSVSIETSAYRDIDEHVTYLVEHAHSPDYPENWYESIMEAIHGLCDFPFSFAVAPENVEFKEEVRHRIVGSYRVLFTVTDDRVHVLHVRHGRQDVPRDPA
jgi:plasmid stabilization system protein ParE